MTKNGIVMHMRWLSVVACLGLVGGGCLQLETSIRLHEDGSATVTERIGFSRRLLDMTRNASAALQLEPMLTREAALERMERMGKGIQLVRHEVREGENGARESLSVYKIGYLGDFVYPSPFMNSRDQIHTIHANIRPNTSRPSRPKRPPRQRPRPGRRNRISPLPCRTTPTAPSSTAIWRRSFAICSTASCCA